jgi:hypothetical protein
MAVLTPVHNEAGITATTHASMPFATSSDYGLTWEIDGPVGARPCSAMC